MEHEKEYDMNEVIEIRFVREDGGKWACDITATLFGESGNGYRKQWAAKGLVECGMHTLLLDGLELDKEWVKQRESMRGASGTKVEA